MKDPAKPRLAGLDALRGIAATVVMLHHYTANYDHYVRHVAVTGLSGVFLFGIFGVDLFFIVSGFVICMTLEGGPRGGDFAVARFARLYPAFVVSMMVTIIALLACGRAIDMWAIMANLTMSPQWFGVANLDASYWTLKWELLFYGLAALFLRGRAPEWPCVVWLMCGFALRITGYADAGFVSILTLTQFAPLFTTGMCLFRIHAGQSTTVTWVILIAGIISSTLQPFFGSGEISRSFYGGMIVCFAGLVAFAASSYGRVFAVWPLRFLGAISYPLYLVHQQAGFLVIERLERSGLPPAAAIPVTILLVVMVAWAISSIIERPAQRLIMRRWRAAAGNRRPDVR